MGSVAKSKDSASSSSSPGWVEAALEAAASRRAGWRSRALVALQADGEAGWRKILFPTQRLEAWKYTSTSDISSGAFEVRPVGAAKVAPATLPVADVDAFRIVFVDGIYSPSLSSSEAPAACQVRRLTEVAEGTEESLAERVGQLKGHDSDPFAALSTALAFEGVIISVPRGAVVDTPIHVVHITTASSTGGILTPRLVLDVEEGAIVRVVESFVSEGAASYLAMPVCEITAGDRAVVDYYRIQEEAESAYHVSYSSAKLGVGTVVNAHVSSFGGKLVRNTFEMALAGSGANGTLNGVTVLSGDQHVDNTTLIHHIEPNAESREHFKGIYAGRSRGVFSGTITVDSEAQKTNAFQSNQSILLSSDASVDSRPQLKIWADDVKCTHGATVGQLDDEALFYLRSRGIGHETARNFLVHAFASEVLSSIRIEGIRTYVEGVLSRKLESLAG